MNLIKTSFKSLANRKLSALMSALAVMISTTLVLSIERIKQGAEKSFAGVITGADFVVGAPGSPLNTLLYSVFHMGEAIKNISYSTYEQVSQNPKIDWTIPISLGDSHRGFRVVATNSHFFKHYRYRNATKLEFVKGQEWDSDSSPNQVVLGHEVAHSLGYLIDSEITLTHGLESLGEMSEHKNNPFKVVGILSKTSTPVDRGLYITLHGMEAIHVGWETGVGPGFFGSMGANLASPSAPLKIKSITSFIVGLKERRDVFHMARTLQNDFSEPLMPVIPGIALSKLWQNLSIFETTLKVLAFVVVFTGFLGVSISLLTSLNERRREMAILRSLGASAKTIFMLLIFESQILTLAGLIAGFCFTYLVILFGSGWIESNFGLSLPLVLGHKNEILFGLIIIGVSLLTSLMPAYTAFKNSINDGLSQKL